MSPNPRQLTADSLRYKLSRADGAHLTLEAVGSIFRRAIPFSVIGLGLLVCSCSKPRDGVRLKTFPVTGVVYVDGSPAGDVLVECTPIGDGELRYERATHTGQDGHFSIGTYDAGDGLPVGKYALTFEWTTGGLGHVSDKLHGRYADPQASEVQITVAEGEPLELGTIRLESK